MSTTTENNVISTVTSTVPLIGNAEACADEKSCGDNTSGARKFCRYHFSCKKTADPEHNKEFICEYKKPCRNGVNCNKAKPEAEGYEKHTRFFTHEPPSEELKTPTLKSCKYGASCKKIKSVKHLSKYLHKETLTQGSSGPKQKTKFPEAEAQYVSAKFSLRGVSVDGTTHNIESVFKKRLNSNLSAEEVKKKMSDSIKKRYVKDVTFSSLNFIIECTVDSPAKPSVVKEVAAPKVVKTSQKLPLPTPKKLPLPKVNQDSLPDLNGLLIHVNQYLESGSANPLPMESDNRMPMENMNPLPMQSTTSLMFPLPMQNNTPLVMGEGFPLPMQNNTPLVMGEGFHLPMQNNTPLVMGEVFSLPMQNTTPLVMGNVFPLPMQNSEPIVPPNNSQFVSSDLLQHLSQ